VFSTGSDPVKFGLVASLNRPGGNATGTVQFTNELSAKRLQILREMVPKARLIGAFYVPGTAVSELRLASVMDAARRIGQEVRALSVVSLVDIDAAFATGAAAPPAAPAAPPPSPEASHVGSQEAVPPPVAAPPVESSPMVPPV
jgi:putative ABC transport system substrate-binding protein